LAALPIFLGALGLAAIELTQAEVLGNLSDELASEPIAKFAKARIVVRLFGHRLTPSPNGSHLALQGGLACAPEDASWLNWFEIWFGILMKKVMKGGSLLCI
jgi:hypothetical protein